MSKFEKFYKVVNTEPFGEVVLILFIYPKYNIGIVEFTFVNQENLTRKDVEFESVAKAVDFFETCNDHNFIVVKKDQIKPAQKQGYTLQ